MKKLLMLTVAVLFGFTLMLGATPGDVQAKTQFVTIGTGGITGVYYPTGGAIAKMINAKRKEYGIRATVESTGGSAFNVNAIMAGDLEFGVVQSDRQYQAYFGEEGSEWGGNPQKDLRAVFSIHPESVTLAASVDSGIKTVMDLKGKRVNLGNPGSGHLKNSKDTLAAVGLDPEKDLKAEFIKAAEAPGLLQDGRLDAFFYTVGHPSGAFKEATAGKTKVVFVAIAGGGHRRAGQEQVLLRQVLRSGGSVSRRDERCQRAHLRCQGHVLHLQQGERRSGLRHHQRSFRQLRQVQEAASGLCRPDQGRHAGRSVGPGSSGCHEVLQGSWSAIRPLNTIVLRAAGLGAPPPVWFEPPRIFLFSAVCCILPREVSDRSGLPGGNRRRFLN